MRESLAHKDPGSKQTNSRPDPSGRIVRGAVVWLLLVTMPVLPVGAQTPSLGEEESGGPLLPILELSVRQLVADLDRGTLTLNQVRLAGLEVFTRPATREDGYGDGPYAPTSGNRPTLGGNGTVLRINGLDAQSCNECHSIVSHDTIPPTFGIGGVGGLAQNAIIEATLIDADDSEDRRARGWLSRDGVADFNGRLSNPPFLFGGGGVELLAKEMTVDLQNLLRRAQAAPPGTITRLLTHGVDFGFLRTEASGEVDLDGVEGIGFEENDGRRPEQVLVVEPFGRKGDRFTMRDFSQNAMRFHFGLEPTEVVGTNVDADQDGVVNEISAGAMTALHIFSVTNPPPVMESLDERAKAGFATFQEIGCASCHRPVLETRSRYLRLAHPELPEDPLANVYLSIDLVEVGFAPSPTGGVYVPLFADLKRHPMGPELAETAQVREIANDEFTTARLWGVRDTAPYLHDGRALTIYEAIVAHGGAAQSARDAFVGLAQTRQGDLSHFLRKLRTPTDPNHELLDLKASQSSPGLE